MWLVAKFKKNELSIFKENLKIDEGADVDGYLKGFLIIR